MPNKGLVWYASPAAGLATHSPDVRHDMKTKLTIAIIGAATVLMGCATAIPEQRVTAFLRQMPNMSLDELRSQGDKLFTRGSSLPDHRQLFSTYPHTDFSDPEPEIHRLRQYDLLRRVSTQQTDVVWITLVRDTGEILQFTALGMMAPCKTEE
jgi:hypothetical protein